MLRGLCRLTWLEIKIFVREPLGVIGTVASRCWSSSCSAGCSALAWRGSPATRAPPCHGRSARASRAAHRAERRAVARHDHLDLPRGRHPQAAARHAAAAAHDPDARTCS